MVGTIAILVSLIFGLVNISRSVNDYHKYDVITNIERITPKSLTVPAVTICIRDIYFEKHTIRTNQGSSIKKFIVFNRSVEDFVEEVTFKDVKYSQLEFFKIPKAFGECVRFNGLVGCQGYIQWLHK